MSVRLSVPQQHSSAAAATREYRAATRLLCVSALFAWMLRPRGPCGLETKSFGLSLGLTLSGLGVDLGLMASGLGLIEIGLVAPNIYSAHDIN